MLAKRFVIIFNTVINLRLEQFCYRAYYRFFHFFVRFKALRKLCPLSFNAKSLRWDGSSYLASTHIEKGVFEFLGERGSITAPEDWNSPLKSKLWLYNLHYFDDLSAEGASQRADLHDWLIERWIADNPPMTGNGWEPYPTALRIVNWIKWFSQGQVVDLAWTNSLARQAQALFVQEERHLLANHLFVDAKALVFAGVFFSGADARRWLARGLRILDKEVPEQFLADGGNFELSPMYHSSLIWDLCDLVCLARICKLPELGERVDVWKKVIQQGVSWLEVMCHSDGGISFFNDATFGIAPTLDCLFDYASDLGCFLQPGSRDSIHVTKLAASGYIAIDWGRNRTKAILDVGGVGPCYQPGHAHADTLSFELSVFGERVFVNSGTSQYGEDCERQRQRGTMAHNTVTVDGQDSSEVWAGFRVARRARPSNLVVQEIGDEISVSCSHDGYSRLPKGGCMHRRVWHAKPGFFSVSDRLEGAFNSAVARFHLHPDVVVGDNGRLVLASGRCIYFSVQKGCWRLVKSFWHPGFGVSVPSSCIEVCLEAAESVVEFTWD